MILYVYHSFLTEGARKQSNGEAPTNRPVQWRQREKDHLLQRSINQSSCLAHNCHQRLSALNAPSNSRYPNQQAPFNTLPSKEDDNKENVKQRFMALSGTLTFPSILLRETCTSFAFLYFVDLETYYYLGLFHLSLFLSLSLLLLSWGKTSKKEKVCTCWTLSYFGFSLLYGFSDSS